MKLQLCPDALVGIQNWISFLFVHSGQPVKVMSFGCYLQYNTTEHLYRALTETSLARERVC